MTLLFESASLAAHAGAVEPSPPRRAYASAPEAQDAGHAGLAQLDRPGSHRHHEAAAAGGDLLCSREARLARLLENADDCRRSHASSVSSREARSRSFARFTDGGEASPGSTSVALCLSSATRWCAGRSWRRANADPCAAGAAGSTASRLSAAGASKCAQRQTAARARRRSSRAYEYGAGSVALDGAARARAARIDARRRAARTAPRGAVKEKRVEPDARQLGAGTSESRVVRGACRWPPTRLAAEAISLRARSAAALRGAWHLAAARRAPVGRPCARCRAARPALRAPVTGGGATRAAWVPSGTSTRGRRGVDAAEGHDGRRRRRRRPAFGREAVGARVRGRTRSHSSPSSRRTSDGEEPAPRCQR